MSQSMSILPVLLRSGACLALVYMLFVLWMGAGLVGVLGFALVLAGGLHFARDGDRPFEDWPLVRRMVRSPGG